MEEQFICSRINRIDEGRDKICLSSAEGIQPGTEDLLFKLALGSKLILQFEEPDGTPVRTFPKVWFVQSGKNNENLQARGLIRLPLNADGV